MPSILGPSRNPSTRRRQKFLLTLLGVLLIVGGGVVLFLLHRIILPLRVAMGFVDIIAGATLLVFVRQQFGSTSLRQ